MTCPWCSGDTKVIESRPDRLTVRRRRVCRGCGQRFTTYERRSHVLLFERDENKTQYVGCDPNKTREDS
jgi:transcriptional regulator NrdR family protein